VAAILTKRDPCADVLERCRFSALRAASPLRSWATRRQPPPRGRVLQPDLASSDYACANAVLGEDGKAKDKPCTRRSPVTEPPARPAVSRAATATSKPFTEAKADSKNPDAGGRCRSSRRERTEHRRRPSPNAIYKQQSRNPGSPRPFVIPDCGNAIVHRQPGLARGLRHLCFFSPCLRRSFVR